MDEQKEEAVDSNHPMTRLVSWIRSEVKKLKRDVFFLVLNLGGWRLATAWCNRARCEFTMRNDPSGDWHVSIGAGNHSARQDLRWATIMAAMKYYDVVNGQDRP